VFGNGDFQPTVVMFRLILLVVCLCVYVCLCVTLHWCIVTIVANRLNRLSSFYCDGFTTKDSYFVRIGPFHGQGGFPQRWGVGLRFFRLAPPVIALIVYYECRSE